MEIESYKLKVDRHLERMLKKTEFQEGISSLKDGISFPLQTFKVLQGPCVYLFLHGGRAVYVGMSGNGIIRALGGRDHKKKFKYVDEVLIYPVKNINEANRIEKILIKALVPALNKQGLNGWDRDQIS
jgi:hypothetical protein